MALESELLANKAQSDLANAQSLVKNDESGETLGTAMYLAQQCIEKQLKSMVLKLDETMGLGLNSKILRSLNHDFYRNFYPIYSKHNSNSIFTEFPCNTKFPKNALTMCNATLNQHLEIYKKTCDHWQSYTENFVWRSLQWKHSLGVPLSLEDLATLNSNYKSYLAHLAADANLNTQRLPQFTNYPPFPALRGILLNPQLIDNCANLYSKHYANSPLDSFIDSNFRFSKTFFEPRVKSHFDGTPFEFYQKMVKTYVMEFSFSLIFYQSIPYMSIFPHNIMGRYPEHLPTGENTTDIYKSQINYILFHLFLKVPYELRNLRKNSRQIHTLWKLGQTHECW